DPVWRVRVVAFDSATRRPGAHWIFDIYEHAWPGNRQAYPKRFYHCKNWRAVRANRARNYNRVEVWRRRRKLQGLLGGAGRSAGSRGGFTCWVRLGFFWRIWRATDYSLFFRGRLEQHYFPRR